MIAVQRRRELKAQRNAIPTPQALSQDQTLNDFNRLRLGRVRDQLEKLDRMIADEEDPQRLDRLASAQARLSEQERILDGRPLPGSRRPREDRARVSAGWIELQPALPGQPSALARVDPAKPLGWEYDDPTPAVLEPIKLPGDVTP